VDTATAVHAWIDAWDRAWRAKDAAPLAAVYADDALFRSHPFRSPQAPLEYARDAFDEEGEDLELWWGKPLVAGDRAAVEYWAVVTENDELVTLAGIATLRFRTDGRVTEQHDYWASNPGRTPPWDGWPIRSAR
jgi:ketosteroid isomerase-like protein